MAIVMLGTSLPSRRHRLRRLIPQGVQARAAIVIAIITLPLLILLIVSERDRYRLATILQRDGHQTALHDAAVAALWQLSLGVCSVVAAAGLMAVVIEFRLLRPMRRLTFAASRLADGQLDTQVDVGGLYMPDMRTLGITLNQMARILEKIALTDSLTAIANRRQFDHVVAGEVKRSMRMKRGLALLLVDVDKFKNYNDLYGHIRGDLCLKRIAAALQSAVRRPSDLVARYGGEEFAVLLPDTDEAGAHAVARELLAAVRSLNIPHDAWERSIVTISVGLAVSIPPPIVEPTVLIERADQALYAAKQAGRDRIVAAEQITRAA